MFLDFFSADRENDIMRRDDVIAHFGTQQKVADALGLRATSTVAEWKLDRIPLVRAMQVEEVTRGKLRVNYSIYGIKRPR